MIRLSGRHWLAALATAMTIHIGVLLGLLWQMPDPGAKSAGFGGIDISLGPSGGGGASPSSEADAVRPEAPSPEPPAEPSPPVKTQKPITKPEPEPEPEPEVEKTPVPVPAEQAEPVPDEPVSELSEVKPRERIPEPPKPPPTEPPPTAAKPTPQPPPRETSKATEAAASERTAALTPSPKAARGEAGGSPGQNAGDGDASSGGGSPGAVADYAALIRAWLERHKQYPRRARLRRLEGTALLYFVMDRKGRVLNYRIQQSAGSTILDREVKAMIERAKPLPEMPEDMHQARLELIVPVTFSLR